MAFDGDPQGIALNSEAVELFRKQGTRAKPGLILSLLTSGMLAFLQDDHEKATSIFEECRTLSTELGDAYGLSQALNYLGDTARIEGDYASAERFYEDSLQLVRAQGFKSDVPAVLHNLGYAVLAQGDHQRARSLFEDGLALQREIGNKQGISECLTGFAALAAATGDLMRAARLFGASEALRSVIGAYMWPAERIEWERQVANARSQSDPADWDNAWRQGSAMTMDEAIELVVRNA
jgi:tetratricopeptide (TPR) repeat protein